MNVGHKYSTSWVITTAKRREESYWNSSHARRAFSQFWSFKYRRKTFLIYIKFVDSYIFRVSNWERTCRVLLEASFPAWLTKTCMPGFSNVKTLYTKELQTPVLTWLRPFLLCIVYWHRLFSAWKNFKSMRHSHSYVVLFRWNIQFTRIKRNKSDRLEFCTSSRKVSAWTK